MDRKFFEMFFAKPRMRDRHPFRGRRYDRDDDDEYYDDFDPYRRRKQQRRAQIDGKMHVIAYDTSGSTSFCTVEIGKSEYGTMKTHYFRYLEEYLMPRLMEKYSPKPEELCYISWNDRAEFETGIVSKSDGGTDPTEMFIKVFDKYAETKSLHIHLITDGDICGFQYSILRELKSCDKVDIYYIGDSTHNIEFYQTVKTKLGSACSVYVNEYLVELYQQSYSKGEFDLSEADQLEILNHDYNDTNTPPAFNKLMGTITTYGSGSDSQKDAIRKTLASLIRKSKGVAGNILLKDDATMEEVRAAMKEQKKSVNIKFEAVITHIMDLVRSSSYRSGSLDGRIFMRNVSKRDKFKEMQKRQLEQGVDNDDMEDPMYVEPPRHEKILEKETLTCAITLETIEDVYVLEASVHSTDYMQVLEKFADKIRQFPWSMLSYLPEFHLSQQVDVILTPYKLQCFFQLNSSKISVNQIFASLYNFTTTSFVVLHRKPNYKPNANDLKNLKDLNFVYASQLFFNKKPGEKLIHTGKKFEIVMIYLIYWKNHLKRKKASDVYIDDLEFTLEQLSEDPDNLCKMPQFSIFYSMKLFKRILTESRIFEPVLTNCVQAVVLRKQLDWVSEIHSDNIIIFIGCLQWMTNGVCPEIMKNNNLLDEKIFEEIMGFAPSRKFTTTEIFRILLTKFVDSRSYKNWFFLVNQLLPLQEFYYNGLPLNFMKFILLCLNHQDFPLNDKVSKENHKNPDMSLFFQYSPNYHFRAKFDCFLFKTRLASSEKVDVCWKTFRPRTFFEHDKIWSDFCPELDHTKEHKERMKSCDSLHISLFKQYELAYWDAERILTLDEFFEYLVRRFPFKTFEPEVIEDVKDVVEIYTKIFSYYKDDKDFIKKRMREMVDLKRRKRYEDECNIMYCYHAKLNEDNMDEGLKKGIQEIMNIDYGLDDEDSVMTPIEQTDMIDTNKT